MHRIAFLALFSFLSVSCALSSPRRGGYGAEQGAPMGQPREVLQQVDQHLRQLGYSPLGPAIHNGNLPQNGVVAYSVDLQPGECIVALAIAPEGTDVNMVLIDPWGRTVGYNVSPDSHPWIAHCASLAGRFTARVQMPRSMRRGQYYYYAAWGAPRGSSPQLAEFFGGAEATVQTAELDQVTTQHLMALDARLSKEGYTRSEQPRGIVLQQGQDRNFPLNLEAGTCYAFASLGGPGATDTDVFVVDGAGNELARDTEQGQEGLARFCAPTTGSYTLRARMYRGHGPLFVAGYAKTPEPQQHAQTAPPTPPSQPLIEAHSQAGPGLEENFRLLDADMQARGYQSYGDPSRGQLGEGQTRDFPIELEGGKCYAILAVGDNGVRDMNLVMLDPSGKALDRDIEQNARPVVRVCPQKSGQFTMRMQMVQGSGKFVYAPYRWPRGTHGPFGLNGIIYVRLAEVTSLLDNEGYSPSPDYSPGKGNLTRQGNTDTQSFELKGGECYSVLVVGGEGVNDLDVTLLEGNKQVATDGTQNAFPSVRTCPDHDTRFHMKITAQNGAGEYFYQIFTRQKQQQ